MNRRGTARIRAFLLLLILAFMMAGSVAAGEETAYRTLRRGDSGEDVLALKTRLYELGYIASTNFTDEYNKTTEERIRQLQKKNGLKADGIATPELQQLIFSDQCLSKSGRTIPAAEKAEPVQFVMPSPAGKKAPALDSDGYLDAEEPYVHADRKAGEWSYVSRDIHVEIRQKKDKSGPHIWLEAAIRYRGDAFFGAMVNESTPENPTKSGTYITKPTTIAKEHSAIFAFSDDFFGYRLLNKQTVGVVIRNGRVWSEKTRKGNAQVWPPLDIMALFPDGHMEVFESDAHTAREYLDMGVVSTFAFGPILVENGAVCQDLKHWRTTDRAPRMAMGITEDGTVLAVDVLGRRKDAVGVTTPWLAEKLISLGAITAINLDGGNTTCMIFMDDVINRPTGTKEKDLRTVNGMIGVREGAE